MTDLRLHAPGQRWLTTPINTSVLGLLMLTSGIASATEPAECTRARQLIAEKKSEQARALFSVCRAKLAKSRSAAPAPTGAGRAPAAIPANAGNANYNDSNAAWLRELPTAAAAIQRMASDGITDLKANQSFGLHTLSEYTVARCRQLTLDPSQFPAVAQARLREYKVYTDALDTQIERPKGDEAARRKVLNYFLSAESVSAYYSLPEVSAKANADSASGKAFQLAVNRDRALASAKGVELGVFGISLGAPLQLPPCGDDTSSNISALFTGLGRGAPQTCVGTSGGDMATGIVALALAASGVQQPPGRKVVTAMLAASKCPDWVKAGGSCTMFITLQDGIVGSIAFQTAPASMESSILSKLREKFHAAPAPDGTFRCSNRYGAVDEEKSYRWDIPGVYATYNALGPDCIHGKVEMQAASFQRLAGAQEAQHEASEGKM